MPPRPLTALAAALALLAAAPAASHAQQAPDGSSREVQRIYEDYGDDGRIDVCDHERDDLQEALDSIDLTFHADFPDFREALEAGVERHENGRCGGGDDAATPTATATAEPTASPDAGATRESGDLPEQDGGDGTGAIPPEDGTLPPEEGAVPPEPTAAPPAATPAAPPAAAVAPTPTPVVVSRSTTDGLLIPGILLGIALLGAAALAAFAIGSRRSPRLNHMWREAAFRSRATWADFSDWLRLGR